MCSFIYPVLEWPWIKIERAIAAMGERGTKVSELEVENSEMKNTFSTDFRILNAFPWAIATKQPIENLEFRI